MTFTGDREPSLPNVYYDQIRNVLQMCQYTIILLSNPEKLRRLLKLINEALFRHSENVPKSHFWGGADRVAALAGISAKMRRMELVFENGNPMLRPEEVESIARIGPLAIDFAAICFVSRILPNSERVETMLSIVEALEHEVRAECDRWINQVARSPDPTIIRGEVHFKR